MKKFALLSAVFVFFLSLALTSWASDDYTRISSGDSLDAPQLTQYFTCVPSRNNVLEKADEVGVRGHALDKLTEMLDLFFQPGIPQPKGGAETQIRRWNDLFMGLEDKDEAAQASVLTYELDRHKMIFSRFARPRQFETAHQ